MSNKLLRTMAVSVSALMLMGNAGGLVQAQVAPGDNVPSVQDALSDPNLDDITDQSDQVVTWVCKQGNNSVAVEVKEWDDWQEIVDANKQWECNQDIPVIPSDEPTFSCETSTTMGLISVFWLEGEGGQEQMGEWMNSLANNRNLVCTHGQTNPFWD